MVKSMSNKNIKNSRNIEKIFIGDICNTNNTISFRDSLTNYKTQITTNSNRGALTDRNSLFSRISEIYSNNVNTNINTNKNTKTNTNDNIPYNRPKTVIKKNNNYMNNIREIKEKKIQFKNPFKDNEKLSNLLY